MFKQMTVHSLVMDPQSNTPIVILTDAGGDRHLPIWIGLLEATSIATQLEKVNFPRPMTHDLMKNVFDQLKVTVDRVEVCDLRDNTYYALIHLRTDGETSRIDARPSDAIAIALRTGAPIYVKEEVLLKSAHRQDQTQTVFRKEDKDKIAEVLEQMAPEDFSKYKM